MSLEKVKKYLEDSGIADRLMVFEASSATVEEAAVAVGCEPKQIAKTLSFLLSANRPILIVAAGDAKVDNRKFKALFHEKARMIHPGEVESYIGHAPGGVCPFAVNEGVTIYLDESLKRFERVYPAAGSGHSAVNLTIDELMKYSGSSEWIDVCKGWE